MSDSNILYYQTSKPSTLKDKIARHTLNKGAEPFTPHNFNSDQDLPINTNTYINSIPYTYDGSPIKLFPQDFSRNKPFQNGELLHKNFNLLENLKPLIESLRNDPGNLTETCVSLLTILNCQGNDINLLKETVDYIVNKCLSSDNYHYSCCRLLDYLIHNLPEPHGKLFKTHLFNQIQDITIFYQEKINGHPNELTDYEIFAYFLADLFSHLEHRYKSPTLQVWSEEKYLPFYIALCDVCDKLIEIPGAVKCLFRILKMTGMELSKFETMQNARKTRKSSPQGTNSPFLTNRTPNLFKRIREKLLSNDTPMSDKEYLLKLLELKASEWGQAQSLLQERDGSPYNYVAQNNSNYYGTLDERDKGLLNLTQGELLTEENILTEEEMTFLHENDMYFGDEDGNNSYLDNENEEVSIHLPPTPLLHLGENGLEKGIDVQNVGGDSTPYETPELGMGDLRIGEGGDLMRCDSISDVYSTPEADHRVHATPVHYMNEEECKDLDELEKSKV